MKTGRQSFTLIEMLVVIAVIIILAGLLLPAVGPLRERGRYAKCTSNLKQLHAAAINYATDYQEMPASASTVAKGVTAWAKDQTGWIDWIWYGENDQRCYWYDYGPNAGSREGTTCITNGMLYTYIRDARIYMCPTFESRKPFAMDWGTVANPVRSYGMNRAARRLNIYALTRASRTLLFADQGFYLDKGREYGRPIGGNQASWSLCQTFWGGDNDGSVFSGHRHYIGFDGEIDPTWEMIGAVHYGNGNCVFCDGHVEKIWYANSATVCAGTWSAIQ